ncbi:MAG: MaoC/PaaZ C-terminal domain-containing protein [Acidimicrobiales bacterium]
MIQQDTMLGLSVGDEIPTFVRENTGLHHFNRYAAVNDEFVPIHMDDDAGHKAGYPSAFGMGNLSTAYLLNVLRSWIGEEGTVRALACQFRQPNLKDTTVVARGRITSILVEDDETVAELEVWTEDGEGNRLAPGTATVAIVDLARI